MSNNYKCCCGRFQDIFEKYSAFSKEGKRKLDEDLVHQIPPKAMLNELRNAPLVPGLGSSFCNFGGPALHVPLDLLLSHLGSDARKVGEMQGTSRETTGVRCYTQV